MQTRKKLKQFYQLRVTSYTKKYLHSFIYSLMICFKKNLFFIRQAVSFSLIKNH